MFSKLFGRKPKPVPANAALGPSGYKTYTAAEFEAHFTVTPEQSEQIAKDYATLIRFNEEDELTRIVFDAGRDLHQLSQALITRYDLNKKQVAGLPLFFANVAGARKEQNRHQGLGIRKCTWLATDDQHAELAGKEYDPSIGIKTPEGYLLPGVTLGCKCVARAVIPGLE